MITIFRKIYDKVINNKYTYYPRYYYYDRLVEHYKDFSTYFKLISLIETNDLLKTKKLITIKDKLVCNKITKRTIKKEFKKPQFEYKIQEKNLRIEIYFYKIYLGAYRAKLEIHMNEGRLFYYNYTFTSNLNNLERQEIINIIQEKYLENELFDESKHIIIDTNGTILHIENSLELKIHYINTNDDIVQLLSIYKQQQEKKQYKIVEQKRKELMKKL